MGQKRIAKGIILATGLVSFLLFLRGNFTLAGVGFIVAGIEAIAFRLCGADVLILAGSLFIFNAWNNKLLFLLTSLLLLVIATYDAIQLYQITKGSGKNDDKKKWLEIFREKQLINILLGKLKKKK